MLDDHQDEPGIALLAIFAHPDDESFTCGGLLADVTGRGEPATLICATRGEAGKTGDPRLDSPEVIGAIREQELRAAMRAVGVTDVRFLDYRDSGMAGTPDNDDPRAFIHAPESEVILKLVAQLRALRPGVVVTFGPDGIYGHPDHLATHRAATAAVCAAGDPTFLPAVGRPWQTPALYYTATPRERLLKLAERPDSPFREMTEAERRRLGTPLAEISAVLDVSAHREAKTRALAAHWTQTGDGGPLAEMPAEHRDALLKHEFVVRAPLPWSEPDAPDVDLIRRLATTLSPIA